MKWKSDSPTTWYTHVKDLVCPVCGRREVAAVHPFDYIKQCMNDRCPYYLKHPKKWRKQWSGGATIDG
jgi:hypothetical protein